MELWANFEQWWPEVSQRGHTLPQLRGDSPLRHRVVEFTNKHWDSGSTCYKISQLRRQLRFFIAERHPSLGPDHALAENSGQHHADLERVDLRRRVGGTALQCSEEPPNDADLHDACFYITCRVSESVGVGPGTCSGEDSSRRNVRVSTAESQERSVHQKAMATKKVARHFNHDRISCAGNVASGERAAEDVEKAAL